MKKRENAPFLNTKASIYNIHRSFHDMHLHSHAQNRTIKSIFTHICARIHKYEQVQCVSERQRL